MRIVQGAGALPEYYDRIGSQGFSYYQENAVSPHIITTRAWIPPGDQKLFVQSVYASVVRGTVATTPGIAGFIISIQVGESTFYELYYDSFLSNEIGAGVKVVIPLNCVLLPGTGLRVATFDASTGGTMRIGALISTIYFS